MEMQLNVTPQERKEKVFTWMRANGLTYCRLGALLGVTAHGVSRMFSRDTIPTRRYSQLLAAGVPPELLPPAKDIPSGPKPKLSAA